MDPLSITASTVTLLQAVNEVISFCYDYKAALNEEPWSLSRILSQTRSIRTVLEQIDLLNLDQHEPDLFAEPLSECIRELDELHALLAPSSLAGKARTHRHAFIRALGWRLKDREVDQHLKNLDRIQSILSLSMLAKDTKALADIKATSDDVDAKVNDIRESLESRSSADRAQRLHRWLSSTDVRSQLVAVSQQRTAETGDWILEQDCTKLWLFDKAGRLWLTGCSGAGKTVLCSSLIESASKIGVTAYFFCDFRIREHCDIVNITGSLLSQLIRQTTHVPDEILNAFQEQDTGPCHRAPTIDLLTQALRSFTNVSIIVDALDEADDPHHLASILSELTAKVFISSREHSVTAEFMNSFERLKLSEHSKEISVDIEKYVNEQLSQNRRLEALNDRVKEHVADVLVNQSAGMFRWTQCQLKTISELRTVKHIRSALHVLPTGLDETYNQILRRVPLQDVYLVRKLLLWLAFAITPMIAGELREAIAICAGEDSIDEEDLLSSVDDVFALCGSLVNVSKSSHLSLAHSSVRDYLLSDKLAPDVKNFALSQQQAYLELAGDCLTYLRFSEFASGPCWSAKAYTERLTRHPLARHASSAWPYYVRGSGIVEPVMEFFDHTRHFMSWVQILNGDYGFKWNIYPPHATPLYYAATFGLRAAVEELLQRSPDLDAPGSRYGGTALHGAAYRGHEAVVSLLLAAGADPNKLDYHQVSPLHSAVEREDEDIVNLLLNHGASTTCKDIIGETPMHRAARVNNFRIINLLEAATAVRSPTTSNSTLCPSTTSSDEQLQFWLKPSACLPGIYDKRSGLSSSIVMGVEIISA